MYLFKQFSFLRYQWIFPNCKRSIGLLSWAGCTSRLKRWPNINLYLWIFCICKALIVFSRVYRSLSLPSFDLPTNTTPAQGGIKKYLGKELESSLCHMLGWEGPQPRALILESLCAYLFSHRNWHSGWGCWDNSHSSGVIQLCAGSISGDQGMREETRYSHLHRHTVEHHSHCHSLYEKQNLILWGLVNKPTTAEF